MTKTDLIKRLKEIGVISTKQVTLRSGGISDFYCDLKKSFGYPDVLVALADEIGKLIPRGTTCIAVSGYGGLPLGAVVAARFELKLVIVRDGLKEHGMGNLIEGHVPIKEDTVVIVDDVLTTGNSIKTTLAGLQGTESSVESGVVVVRRAQPDLPIPYQYVFSIEDLMG